MTVPLSRWGVLVRTNYTNIWFLVLNQLVLIYLYIYLCCLQLNRIGSLVYGSRIGANKILNETLLFTLFLSKKKHFLSLQMVWFNLHSSNVIGMKKNSLFIWISKLTLMQPGGVNLKKNIDFKVFYLAELTDKSINNVYRIRAENFRMGY